MAQALVQSQGCRDYCLSVIDADTKVPTGPTITQDYKVRQWQVLGGKESKQSSKGMTKNKDGEKTVSLVLSGEMKQ